MMPKCKPAAGINTVYNLMLQLSADRRIARLTSLYGGRMVCNGDAVRDSNRLQPRLHCNFWFFSFTTVYGLLFLKELLIWRMLVGVVKLLPDLPLIIVA